MQSNKIRSEFLEFFREKGHHVVASAPMVIKNDPTLMFTNAGMNQFKDIFLGNETAKYTRVTDSQKCLRVSGKHNDLEEVGVDTYHHTMFEMLGNWSFGDYYKKEAIQWAWELLTEVYKIDPEKLYVSVFGGDEQDNLPMDTEALQLWKAIVPEERIIKSGKKDNFWEMGEIGPCGPCSEIHVDLRSAEDRSRIPGRQLVNADHPQVVEIWNLVFMELQRSSDGSLSPLPNKHIDTGMGFERLCMALQGKSSNYDTDVFSPLISFLSEKSGINYQQSDSKQDIALRVIADHVRAVSFAIADGQMPSNTGAGYVIRRILRRAVRYGYSFLSFKEPFICELSGRLVEQLGGFFSELQQQSELIYRVIKEEEESFLKTLERGISRIQDIMAKEEGKEVSGEVVFELYDTFGFPADLTALILAEGGKTYNEGEFLKSLQVQKERSRKAGSITAGDWVEIKEAPATAFLGYDSLEAEVNIIRYRKVKTKKAEQVQLVFDQTPFYPEGGGQIGDRGNITDSKGNKLEILDTKKENNLIIHFVERLPDNLEEPFKASVDKKSRMLTENNHSATHLLHFALREILGDHVQQKGSLVTPEYLRFDFSHFSKVENEQLGQIERRVNELIRQNSELFEKRSVPIKEASEMGAMALFGEKYGEEVRVIQFGNSIELCGGTHVKSTGNIGFFKITSEGSVAAGIRRIEAITSVAAEEYIYRQVDMLTQIAELVKAPKDPLSAVESLIAENSSLKKEVENFKKGQAKTISEELLAAAEQVNGVSFVSGKMDLDNDTIKDIAFRLRQKSDNVFMVLGSVQNEKATLSVAISDLLVKSKDLNAGKIIRDLAKHIQGGGGGQPFFATAGGKNPAGIDEALNAAKQLLSNLGS